MFYVIKTGCTGTVHNQQSTGLAVASRDEKHPIADFQYAAGPFTDYTQALGAVEDIVLILSSGVSMSEVGFPR